MQVQGGGPMQMQAQQYAQMPQQQAQMPQQAQMGLLGAAWSNPMPQPQMQYLLGQPPPPPGGPPPSLAPHPSLGGGPIGGGSTQCVMYIPEDLVGAFIGAKGRGIRDL